VLCGIETNSSFLDFAAESEHRKMEKKGSDARTSGSPAQEKVTHRDFICGCIRTGYALTPTLV
jgi:hypothetical protein